MQRWPLAVLHAHCFSWSHLVFHAVALYGGLALWIAAEEMPAMRGGGGEGTSFALLVWGAGKGRSMRAPEFEGSDLLPRLRYHHLRPAGATLALVRIIWTWGGGVKWLIPPGTLPPLLTVGILCHQQMRHSWDSYSERRQKNWCGLESRKWDCAALTSPSGIFCCLTWYPFNIQMRK